MKWLLAALAAALIAGYVLWQRNSVKTSYVNGLPPYTNLPGRDFILERDCYIFKFKSRDSDWPYFASHATVPELPAEVTQANVGKDFPDARILGVLRIGDHFRIASVRRDQSRTETRISFEVALSNESTRPYPRLDAYWIMDHSPEKDGNAPWILTSYAVAIGKE
jgi:hypothetical protein